MESETETENYKNTSMPPSARLEENKKKEPFSSAATGSLSAVTSGTSSPESAIRRLPALHFPGWSEHPQTGASRVSQETGGPAPLRLSSLGTGPRAVLGDGPSHHKCGSVIRDTRERAHGAPSRPPALTPHTLLSENVPPATLSPRSCLLSQT